MKEFENLPYQHPAWDWAQMDFLYGKKEERERNIHMYQNTHTHFYFV